MFESKYGFAVGVYGNVIDSIPNQSYVVIENLARLVVHNLHMDVFVRHVAIVSSNNQSSATAVVLLTLDYEMQLGLTTGDNQVGDEIQIILNSTTSPIDTNSDGVVDSTKVIPAERI